MHPMSEETDEKAPINPGRPDQGDPLPPAQWSKPWAQLKFVSFQPAIFPRMLGEVSRDARPGDLVSVYDKFGHRVGTGLFNPRAKMPLRVVTHSGQPVGEEYFETAIRRAVALRKGLFKLDETTDAWRVINSDGDGISGPGVDHPVFSDCLESRYLKVLWSRVV